MLQVQLEIRPDPTEVGRARRWARSRLAGSGVADDEPLAETLILLVSELVTNAVVHTGCPAVLRLSFQGAPQGAQGAVAGGFVRLEVADLSPCPPAPRHADGDETNGRGLELVDGLADRWGGAPRASASASGASWTDVRPLRCRTEAERKRGGGDGFGDGFRHGRDQGFGFGLDFGHRIRVRGHGGVRSRVTSVSVAC